MSNRFADAGFLPPTPELPVAARAGAMVSQTRLQTRQAFELGRAFFELPGDIWNMLGRLARTIDTAVRLRDAVNMDDRRLADLGIRRDELPALLAAGRLGEIMDAQRPFRRTGRAF